MSNLGLTELDKSIEQASALAYVESNVKQLARIATDLSDALRLYKAYPTALRFSLLKSAQSKFNVIAYELNSNLRRISE